MTVPNFECFLFDEFFWVMLMCTFMSWSPNSLLVGYSTLSHLITSILNITKLC